MLMSPSINSGEPGGLVDLQQEHVSESVGQLQLVGRSAAYVQRRCRLFHHHIAGSVNGPREQRVAVGIDGCQARRASTALSGLPGLELPP
jgi:hypothetical protein